MTDAFSVRAAARVVPRALALSVEGRAYTFAELAAYVEAAREWLEAQGIGPGRHVAVQAHNGLGAAVLLYALIEHGVPFVPLHPRLTEREAEVLVRDAEPSTVLHRDEIDALAMLPPSEPRAHEGVPPSRGTLAVLYTSGTTGRPKGAVLSRAAFLASARASEANLGWRPDDRWLLCLPVCHVGGLSVLTRCLCARRAVVLEPRFEPRAVLETLVRERATLLSVVPTMLRALLLEDRGNVLAQARAVLVGGAATPPALLEECARRGVNARTTYGLTEACSQVTTQRWDDPIGPNAGSGHPLPGVRVEVVDEQGAAVAASAPGRIRVAGPTLMDGYLHGEPLGGRPFDTGDVGAFDGTGRLHVFARRTDLIVTGGENVYPVEVEQALEACEGVGQALVFGVPDEVWGHAVAAVLVPSVFGALDDPGLARVQAELAERLAGFKRPRRACVVDKIPALPSGKPDRAGALARFGARLRAWG